MTDATHDHTSTAHHGYSDHRGHARRLFVGSLQAATGLDILWRRRRNRRECRRTDTSGGFDDCVPHIPDDEIGYTYACKGTGNGWLMVDVDGDPKDPEPECVNWGPDGKPKNPTTAD